MPTMKTDLVSLEALHGSHRTAEGFASSMSARTYLVDGIDGAGCATPTCPQAIAWVDIDDPQHANPWQPEGFQCDRCERWSCNGCGNRAERICGPCCAGA